CSAPNLTLYGNTFLSNFAGGGGGFTATGTRTLAIINNLVARNFTTGGVASNGAGIYCSTTSTTSNLFIVNNTIFANQSQSSGGGLACVVSGTTEQLNVFNNIIWGNSATGNGADVWLAGTGLRKTFLYNDVHDMYGVWDIAANLLDLDP